MSIGDILQPEPAKRMDCLVKWGLDPVIGLREELGGGFSGGDGDGRSYSSSTGAKWGFF